MYFQEQYLIGLELEVIRDAKPMVEIRPAHELAIRSESVNVKEKAHDVACAASISRALIE